ncbi:MAG: hypothetical protein M3136_08135 [Thermoproteota archaeon]|nr:hypothetical protein [Thermoproteota archaeon]
MTAPQPPSLHHELEQQPPSSCCANCTSYIKISYGYFVTNCLHLNAMPPFETKILFNIILVYRDKRHEV